MEKDDIILGAIAQIGTKIDAVSGSLSVLGERVARLEASHGHMQKSIEQLQPQKPVKLSLSGLDASTKKVVYIIAAIAGAIATIFGGISLVP